MIESLYPTSSCSMIVTTVTSTNTVTYTSETSPALSSTIRSYSTDTSTKGAYCDCDVSNALSDSDSGVIDTSRSDATTSAYCALGTKTVTILPSTANPRETSTETITVTDSFLCRDGQSSTGISPNNASQDKGYVVGVLLQACIGNIMQVCMMVICIVYSYF